MIKILEDLFDYDTNILPSYILGIEDGLIPLILEIGFEEEDIVFDIFVEDSHYDYINHDKSYVIFHGDVDYELFRTMEIPYQKVDPDDMNKHHIHLWREFEPATIH